MCIEYNEGRYGGMYNINVKRKCYTEIVHMNAGVSYEKENVKESQSRSVTPSPDTPSGVGLGASQILNFHFSIFNCPNFKFLIF